MADPISDWEFTFKYIVPSATAIAVAIIGLFQYRLNKTQQEIVKLKNIIENEDHRFKFYEKRSQLFFKLEMLLGSIKGNGSVTQKHMDTFTEEIWPDQWLLPYSYYNYFREIRETMKNNMFENKEYAVSKNPEQKELFMQKANKSFEWLENAKDGLYKKFEPVLRIPNN